MGFGHEFGLELSALIVGDERSADVRDKRKLFKKNGIFG